MLSLIVAVARNNVIGKGNALPWHFPADLRHFKRITMGHPILMGRKTWESIGRPLPGRTSIVVSRQSGYCAEGAIVVPSIEGAIEKAGQNAEIFVIGGAEIFRQAMQQAQKLYLTRIHCDYEGDIFFLDLDEAWIKTQQQDFFADAQNPCDYSFCIFEKKLNNL